ncbi:MAG: hypothetical protein R3E79_02770 [Caldilineaceae bacterium]
MKWLHTQVKQLQRNLILTFVIGAFLGWALENTFAQALALQGLAGVVGLLLVLVAAVLIYLIGRNLFTRLFPAPKILVGIPPEKRRGVILLFSNEETLRKAVDHHHPALQHLWLIVTPQAKEKAQAVIATLDEIEIFEQPVRTPWNPDDTALAVRRALEHAYDLDYRRADLICDVTGGTKPMTIGAAVACMAQELTVQMVAARYNEYLQDPHALEVFEIRL